MIKKQFFDILRDVKNNNISLVLILVMLVTSVPKAREACWSELSSEGNAIEKDC